MQPALRYLVDDRKVSIVEEIDDFLVHEAENFLSLFVCQLSILRYPDSYIEESPN